MSVYQACATPGCPYFIQLEFEDTEAGKFYWCRRCERDQAAGKVEPHLDRRRRVKLTQHLLGEAHR